MRYIELFAGIGGFKNAANHLAKDTDQNFECVAFSEIDKYAITSYKSNYNADSEIAMGDITQFTSDENNINQLPDFDLLLGGFPCQAFSLLGKQLGLEDERGKILFSIHELLKEKNPEFIVLENVRNIIKHDKGKTLNLILDFFKDHKYKYINYVILDSKDFGLPQRRSRIFFVCSKRELNIDLSENSIIDNFNSIKNKSLQSYSSVLDILEKNVGDKYYLSEKIKHTILDGGSKNFWSKSQIDLSVARTLTATMVKLHRACQDNYYSDDFINKGISHQETHKEVLYKKPVRRLTPKEALKLQGFNDDFFNNAISAGVSEHQLYKQAGNALSVNTGYALLHYLFIKLRIQDL
ncbi:DNA cytosine methyltransferase [Pedobacter caeni]|uniref:Cytosine-specific methyltransferase n=1 Tax=Pedobacter caeni TaxID=288992 RepID=A0A1M5JN90_9SPHI|nr:DNA (cytosine-5-)-methyltransferase [Pedobacter caeni]SHG42056.1 DNA (cytosine-5)-methyltransferase 1 [Pedobacter caeni]